MAQDGSGGKQEKKDVSVEATAKLAADSANSVQNTSGYSDRDQKQGGNIAASLFVISTMNGSDDDPTLFVDSEGNITKDKPSEVDVAVRRELTGEHLSKGKLGAPDFSSLPFGKVGKQEVLEKFAGKGNEVGVRNLRGFLDTLAYAEGTIGRGDNGYNIKVGYGQINSYDHHPHEVVRLSPTLASSAAGRYQFLSKTWDSLAAKMGLKDFSQNAQDAAALELVREAGALQDILNGDVERALHKCRGIWASLPGAGYGQPERKMDTLLSVYERAGGKFRNDMKFDPALKERAANAHQNNVPGVANKGDIGSLKTGGSQVPAPQPGASSSKPDAKVVDATKGAKLGQVAPKVGVANMAAHDLTA